MSRSWRLASCALAVIVALGAAAPRPADTRVIFVAPRGNDGNPGTSGQPIRTLGKALDGALPGTVIELSPGIYEPAETRRPGLPDAPIVIRGRETGRDAANRFRTVIRGARIVLQINHSYYRVEGLTFDGQPAIDRTSFPSELARVSTFKDSVGDVAANSKLIYIGYAPGSRDITGVVLHNLFLHGAGGECVRMRNNAFGNVLSNSVIQWCGMAPSGDGRERFRYHNGEGVYIGTSPKSTTQPMFANDTSHDNVVRDSVIRTFGSECFQVKENAHDNRMQRVDCRANMEPLSFGGSNVELRGDHNTIEDSTIGESLGVNVKIASDDPQYDRGGNSLLRNRFLAAAGPHLLSRSARPPGLACGNTFATTRIIDGPGFGEAAAPCAR